MQEALNVLDAVIDEGSSFSEDLILLKSRFSDWKKKSINGTISLDEENLIKSKLRVALLDLTEISLPGW